jgi:hypothetical protein
MFTVPCLDLAILDSGTTTSLAIYARFADDTAFVLASSTELAELIAIKSRFEESVSGGSSLLTNDEIRTAGEKLFNTVIRDSIADLYNLVPKNAPIRILIASNHDVFQRLPWELMQQPNSVGAPDPNRVIVRVVPTVGVRAPPPLPRGQRLRVLFAVAEPLELGATDWNDTYVLLRNRFGNRVDGDKVDLAFVRTTTADALFGKLTERDYDVFHFYGHGEVINGVGNLALVADGQKAVKGSTDYAAAPDLARTLSGTHIRLVIMSACNSASGNFQNDFSVLSKALIKAGVPAVVANQSRVSVPTVAPFAGALYMALLQSGDIDDAVAKARGRLALTAHYSVDWAIPVLYRHISAPLVFA